MDLLLRPRCCPPKKMPNSVSRMLYIDHALPILESRIPTFLRPVKKIKRSRSYQHLRGGSKILIDCRSPFRGRAVVGCHGSLWKVVSTSLLWLVVICWYYFFFLEWWWLGFRGSVPNCFFSWQIVIFDPDCWLLRTIHVGVSEFRISMIKHNQTCHGHMYWALARILVSLNFQRLCVLRVSVKCESIELLAGRFCGWGTWSAQHHANPCNLSVHKL